jgi:pimeloyl-ACP methyl ester carboxylesterase
MKRKNLRWPLLALLFSTAISGCGDSDSDGTIAGPGVEAGTGRVYAVDQVTFPTIDSIQISALFGVLDGAIKNRTVILVHELGTGKEEWLQNTSLFLDLLENGYNVLALDLRGHGGTALPDGRLQISLEDLESSYLDVSAAVTWLQARPEVDAGRVAVIGDGVGGNVAFVIMGAIPQRIKAAVALSPGIWVGQDAQPAVIGAGINPFGPHSILYLVGSADVLPLDDGRVLSYAGFAGSLATITTDPNLIVFDGATDHGLALLNNIPAASESLFLWLESHLQ